MGHWQILFGLDFASKGENKNYIIVRLNSEKMVSEATETMELDTRYLHKGVSITQSDGLDTNSGPF